MADPTFPSPLAGESGGTPPPGEGNTPSHLPAAPSPLPSLLAAGVLFAASLAAGLGTNNDQDFFIYRIGAVLGVRGESPYDVPKVRALVAAQYPDPDPKPDSFVNNNGYFPPPLAIAVFAPFALVGWTAAKVLWALVTAFAGWGLTRIPDLFREPGRPPVPLSPLIRWLLPFLLLLNPLTLAIVVVGQTTLLFVGCVALGQWCFERGRLWPGALLWAVPFVKPHLALPLVPLAWYLGGWKRGAAVLGVVAALNLTGATMAGGSPLFLRDYLDYVPTAHKAVMYNRVELNPQITSWNCLLYWLTRAEFGDRFLVELTITTTVAGYLIWGGLVTGRCAAANRLPSPAWAVAAAVAGGLICCQVLGYEVLFLAALVPWVRDLFAAGWKARAWAAVGVMVLELVPLPPAVMGEFGSHRSVGVAVLAALVLAGPVRVTPRP